MEIPLHRVAKPGKHSSTPTLRGEGDDLSQNNGADRVVDFGLRSVTHVEQVFCTNRRYDATGYYLETIDHSLSCQVH